MTWPDSYLDLTKYAMMTKHYVDGIKMPPYGGISIDLLTLNDRRM